MLQCLDRGIWRSRLLIRSLGITFLILFAFTNYSLYTRRGTWTAPPPFVSKHPIHRLAVEARLRHEAILDKRSRDIHSAASRYRERRGRHPPPGFDKWFAAAKREKAVVVEDYFDRIYKDLTPYWGLPHQELAERASAWWWVVKVRNGTAFGAGDAEGRVPWLQLWTELVQEMAAHLPDLDMPINYMDEPRLLVPYAKVDELVKLETSHRSMTELNQVTTEYSTRAEIDSKDLKPYDPKWIGNGSYWNLAVEACSPETPAHGVKQLSDDELKSPFSLPEAYNPPYAYRGYIRNWTAASDPCLQPHLRALHGSFIAPLSLSTSKELIPLFGGSKLSMNNEILIPGAMYLTNDAFYHGGNDHGKPWSTKKSGVVWRGDASGGQYSEHNWHRFHRHRLVDMLNGTTVTDFESGESRPKTFDMPDASVYDSKMTKARRLGQWISSLADSAFVHLCNGGCEFADRFFHIVPEIPMKEQFANRFLPDVDGNSFSARFRGFMRSTSLPIKATVYAEWHDDRLVPWVHFVPMDNTFRDLYPILEYLSDATGVNPATGEADGDNMARTIAEAGQKWAEKVLRREDMKLYVWRLLLEWARVCDPNRDTLGYTGDIIS